MTQRQRGWRDSRAFPESSLTVPKTSPDQPYRNQVEGHAVLFPTVGKERHCEEVRGMECKEVLFRLWEYLDEELGPEEAMAVTTHMSHCQTCYPAYCWDRSFLDLLARQREVCSAPAALIVSIRTQLEP
jgi:Putative zinc-finger